MKPFVFLLLASLLGLAGCAQEAVGPSGPAAFGWRSAGLVMPNADHDGGFASVISVAAVVAVAPLAAVAAQATEAPPRSFPVFGKCFTV